MTFEARVLFVVAFFAIWCVLGFLSWSAMAVARRGRGVLPALPVAVLGACLGGLAMPLIGGARDERGLVLSIGTAFLGGVLGTAGGIYLTEALLEPPIEGSAGPAAPTSSGSETPTTVDSERDA